MLLSIKAAAMRCVVLAVLVMLAGVVDAGTVSPRRLLEVADIASPVLSPDGTQVAFRVEQASVDRNVYESTWYVQDLDGPSLPHAVGEGGTPLRDYSGVSLPPIAVWSPDGRWIFYRAFLNGQVGVWRAAADGSGAESITRDAADVRSFLLSANGKDLEYSVGATREKVAEAEQAEYDQGIRIDETVPVGQVLFRSGFVGGRLATQRLMGGDIERGQLLAEVPVRWKRVNLITGATQSLENAPALPPNSDIAGNLKPWKVARDAQSGRVALLRRFGTLEGLRDEPEVELSMLLHRKSRQPVICSDPLCVGKAISDIQWRSGTDEVVFTVTDPAQGLAQSLFRWNVDTGVVRPVTYARGVLGGGGRYDPGECGLASSALVCVAAEADSPPRLERVDLETGKRTLLFEPNAALGRDMATATPARLLRWKDANGQEFTGQFFAASGTQGAPAPLFVSYYSCPGFVRGGLGDEWPMATLAEDGIAALCINHAPVRLDAVERYDQGLSAVASAVDLLASTGEIDRAKVGMGGLSFGTETTLWTAMYSDLLAAASVSSSSISTSYYQLKSLAGNSFRTRLREYWQLGAPDETSERWHTISPAFNLDKIKVPILMQLPEQEYIHALDYTIPLLRQHRADLYVFPDEPHLKFQPRHKLAVYERNVDWFRFWLQGVEDPAYSKSTQYAHWRKIRARSTAGSTPGL